MPIVFARPILPVSIISQDSFTDADNTHVENHVMDIGSGWSTVSHSLGPGGIVSSDALIQNNQVQFLKDGSGVVTNIGASDATIEVEWIPSVGTLNRNSIILRYTNALNHFIINMREDNNDIQIVKFQAAANDILDVTSFTFSEGTSYTIKAVLSGSSIKGYIDGVEMVSAVSTFQQTNQVFGVGRNSGSNATRVDNWKAVA